MKIGLIVLLLLVATTLVEATTYDGDYALGLWKSFETANVDQTQVSNTYGLEFDTISQNGGVYDTVYLANRNAVDTKQGVYPIDIINETVGTRLFTGQDQPADIAVTLDGTVYASSDQVAFLYKCENPTSASPTITMLFDGNYGGAGDDDVGDIAMVPSGFDSGYEADSDVILFDCGMDDNANSAVSVWDQSAGTATTLWNSGSTVNTIRGDSSRVDGYAYWADYSLPAGGSNNNPYIYRVKGDGVLERIFLNIDADSIGGLDSAVTVNQADGSFWMVINNGTHDVYRVDVAGAVLLSGTDYMADITLEIYDLGYDVPNHAMAISPDGKLLALGWDGGVDRMYVYNLSLPAVKPTPCNDCSVFASTTTELGWTNPPSNGTLTADVWLSTESNTFLWTSADLLEEDLSVAPGATASVTINPALVEDETYYWRVDITDSINGLTIGNLWTFTTSNMAPEVEAGIKQNVWLESGSATVTLNGSATDDGLPNPPGAVTFEWTSVPSTGVSFVNNADAVTDVTFTAAGDYMLTLEADDSADVGSDTVLVRVFVEGSVIGGIITSFEDADDGNVLIAAHRGDNKNYPENSIIGMLSAVDIGAQIVEVDVRKTEDDVFILMHDSTIDRTTNGSGTVSELTYAELQNYYLKYSDGSLSSFKIPTLQDTMIALKGKCLMILDKSNDYFDECADLARSCDVASQVLIKSSESDAVMLAYLIDNPDIYYGAGTISQGGYESKLETLDGYLEMISISYEYESSWLITSAAQALSDQYDVRVWNNSLDSTPDSSAGHTDSDALIDPDANWGWQIDHGIDIIQTDELEALKNYLCSIGKHYCYFDGTTDMSDFGLFNQNWLTNSGDPDYDCRWDFVQDGTIDMADLLFFASYWISDPGFPM